MLGFTKENRGSLAGTDLREVAVTCSRLLATMLVVRRALRMPLKKGSPGPSTPPARDTPREREPQRTEDEIEREQVEREQGVGARNRRQEGKTDERRAAQTKGGGIRDSGNGTESKGDIGGYEDAKGKEGEGHGEHDMGRKRGRSGMAAVGAGEKGRRGRGRGRACKGRPWKWWKKIKGRSNTHDTLQLRLRSQISFIVAKEGMRTHRRPPLKHPRTPRLIVPGRELRDRPRSPLRDGLSLTSAPTKCTMEKKNGSGDAGRGKAEMMGVE
ncbi:hypothetical protein B0H13DRAFT_1850733 [Mycena leptocephala]|nr:hypothetical protein B0H13DRAFT_1850733 [Mycena leptocephala]